MNHPLPHLASLPNEVAASGAAFGNSCIHVGPREQVPGRHRMYLTGGVIGAWEQGDSLVFDLEKPIDYEAGARVLEAAPRMADEVEVPYRHPLL
jgi:hypothetical protein